MLKGGWHENEISWIRVGQALILWLPCTLLTKSQIILEYKQNDRQKCFYRAHRRSLNILTVYMYVSLYSISSAVIF
jgi:hypothetical protein